MLAHDDFQLLNTTIINFSNLIGCQKAGNQQSNRTLYAHARVITQHVSFHRAVIG